MANTKGTSDLRNGPLVVTSSVQKVVKRGEFDTINHLSPAINLLWCRVTILSIKIWQPYESRHRGNGPPTTVEVPISEGQLSPVVRLLSMGARSVDSGSPVRSRRESV